MPRPYYKNMLSFRAETKELNDDTRRFTGGSFVSLRDGVTHYELGNNTREDTVVLVHGFSVPYFIYDPTFHFLAQNNFRVLRYDLFGRGFSDRPDADYSIDLFVRQLSDLLDALRLTRPVSLIGLSMGGAISATFTARHPERVSKLVLIDPAGGGSLPYSRILKLATKPFLGEALLHLLVGSSGIIQKMSSNFLKGQHVDESLQERYLVQLQFKGFKRAILSTIRNNTVGSCLDIYRTVGRLNKPTMLFWGRNDTTVPLQHSDDICAAIPNIEFHIFEGCSHIPHYEKPEETNPLLLEFLRK
jgi:pimeloyl-ACP methyl ester carboxylesterase